MKKYIKSIVAFIAICFLGLSCQEDIETGYSFETYNFSGLDAQGGTWKTILIGDVNQYDVKTPEATNSANYLKELADLKLASAKPSTEQLTAIKYWGNNGLIRWNEIARDLVAKYNLPPAPNPDGSYGVPNSASPSTYPYFPFSHPPYACRMLAYLSGAQYDALIAAWNLKYKYNRLPAYLNDSSIVTNLPKNNLPGYPSEGAVIATVSQTILIAMFPLAKDYIALKAAEHKNVLGWAGINVKSEITAGDSLAKVVAAVYTKRASTDGMKNAQTPRPISDSIKLAAKGRFGWAWDNLEDPVRPVGITPLFGSVKPWFIPSVEAVRPLPPPAIGSTEFNVAAEELKTIAKNLTFEQRQIANFWSDGIGTYSPPGHWNRIACEHIVSSKYNPLRTARILAYLNMAIMDGGVSCWDTKYYYHYPRPSQVIPGFKTILGIPNFPSYSSGHSVFSGAGAEVLSHFFPNSRSEFEEIAKEASLSRVYGGIHFRFDSEIGVAQGKNIGSYSVNVAKADGVE